MISRDVETSEQMLKRLNMRVKEAEKAPLTVGPATRYGDGEWILLGKKTCSIHVLSLCLSFSLLSLFSCLSFSFSRH